MSSLLKLLLSATSSATISTYCSQALLISLVFSYVLLLVVGSCFLGSFLISFGTGKMKGNDKRAVYNFPQH